MVNTRISPPTFGTHDGSVAMSAHNTRKFRHDPYRCTPVTPITRPTTPVELALVSPRSEPQPIHEAPPLPPPTADIQSFLKHSLSSGSFVSTTAASRGTTPPDPTHHRQLLLPYTYDPAEQRLMQLIDAAHTHMLIPGCDFRSHTVSVPRLRDWVMKAADSQNNPLYNFALQQYDGSIHQFLEQRCGFITFNYTPSDLAQLSPAIGSGDRRMYPAALGGVSAALAADKANLLPKVARARNSMINFAIDMLNEDMAKLTCTSPCCLWSMASLQTRQVVARDALLEQRYPAVAVALNRSRRRALLRHLVLIFAESAKSDPSRFVAWAQRTPKGELFEAIFNSLPHDW